MLVCLFASMSYVVFAQDVNTNNDMKDLVEKLASPNPAPKYGNGDVAYPKNYDKKKQEQVYDARLKIYQLGTKAFPYLLAHIDDERYSFVGDSGPTDQTWTVGKHSRDIVRSQVEAYSNWWSFSAGAEDEDPRSRERRPSYCAQFFKDKKTAAAWWEKHQSKTLYEIQVEALQWVIAEEASKPNDFSNEEKKYLDSKLKELLSTKQPLKPFFIGSK
jgi:hypothetical protein